MVVEYSEVGLDSSNNDICRVDDQGDVIAISNGEATITKTIVSGGKTFTDQKLVLVGKLNYGEMVTRNYNDIALARITSKIEVNEEYACQAYALSAVTADHAYKYGYSDENIVSFESDRPDVCRVKNGVLRGVSPGSAKITVKAGSVSKEFTVTVVPETLPPENNPYMVQVLGFDPLNAESCTIGLKNLFERLSEQGYNKVILPGDQHYNVSPIYGSISIPSNMVVDFNGGVIQILPSEMTTEGGYVMFILNDTQYTEVRNATILGERFLIEGNGVESCVSVYVCGNSYKSGFRNCVISQSPGFNGSWGNTNRKVRGVTYTTVVPGGLDSGGQEIDADYTYRSAFTRFDITNKKGRFALGNKQGYGGYMYMSARVYNIYFYDVDKNFISSIENCLQYYFYDAPSNAYYARITYNWDSPPTNGDPDFHAIAHLYSFDLPYWCGYWDCTFKDNFSLASSVNGGESMIIDNCYFENNGYRDPAGHLDWEDGRQDNKGHVLRNCIFKKSESYTGGVVEAIGADGLIIHNNIFDGVKLTIGEEVQNSRVWLNTFINNNSGAEIRSKTDMVFSQNCGYDGAIYKRNPITGVSFDIRESSNKFE